jgi:hypothetical protein
MAVETANGKKLAFLPSVSDRDFFIGSAIVFLVIILAMIYISSFFMNNASATYDTGRFYSMAKVIVSGSTPYIAYQDPKPPLIFFTLTLPILLGQQFLGGIALVGLCNLASAILIMMIAWRLYGRVSGLVAGILFTLNITWAQGYFVMTEPFTILFLLIATYLVLCDKNRYFIAGASAGIAIGFKQYALISVPLLLLFMYLNREIQKAPAFITGITIPLIAMFSVIFLVYGVQALDASMYWSFGVAGPYITGQSINGVISSEATNWLELVVNIFVAICILVSTSLAVVSFIKYRRMKAMEIYLLLSSVCFSLTLIIRQYLHYWLLALPFLAIFWAGWLFHDERRSWIKRIKLLMGHTGENNDIID